MIHEDDIGFPIKSESFLEGEPFLYSQFNDVDFFVEDEGQENFYFAILKKLFTNINFVKIFPLEGKNNVKEHARANLSDKKKVFIVDKDFDDILNKIEILPNLFYLNRYSIENYLIEDDAIVKVVIAEKPRVKEDEIKSRFNLDSFIDECSDLFSELVCCYLTIQKHDINKTNVSNAPERFCIFYPQPAIKQQDFDLYKNEIDTLLKAKDTNLCAVNEINSMKQLFSLSNCKEEILKHVPGKYLLHFLKNKLEKIFEFTGSMSFDSFTFKLAERCQLSSLFFLRDDVVQYVHS